MGAENTLTVRLVECAKTAAQWAALLTIPKRGEICLEMENQGTNENPDLLFKMKIGDGKHTYANLNYFPVDANIAQVVASWVEQNLDVNEYAQASYDDATKKLSVYGIKEVDGKIVKGTNHVDIQLAEGTKIDITSDAGVITIAHEGTTRTDTTKSSAGYGTSVVTGVTTDSTGHVTGVETGPLPTKPATKNVIGTSAAATTDGASANPYLNHIEDGDVKSHHQLIGGTQVDVNSDASGNVTIKHETITRTDTEESAQPTNLVTEITTSNGHVTGAKTIKPDDLIVGIAKDLDAPVVRSDNSMWNHRVTGGTINIGEETAKIPVLKGNTLVWNQLILSGNSTYNQFVARYGTLTVSNDILNFTITVLHTSARIDCDWRNFIRGHKYFLSAYINSPRDTAASFYVTSFTPDILCPANTWTKVMAITTIGDETIEYGVYCNRLFQLSANDVVQYKQIFVVDLTKMFGAGNEPATVEEFERLFPIEYAPYCEGRLVSLGGYKIKWNQMVPETKRNFTNTITDSKDYFNLYINTGATSVYTNTTPVSVFSCKVTASENGYFSIKHNGATADIWLLSNSDLIPCVDNHQYYVKFSVVSANPSTVGGLVVNNIQIIDLTTMFGPGSEPTLEEFEAMFPDDYYEYNEGTEMNIFDAIGGKKLGLKSTGFNLWDEKWEKGANRFGVIEADNTHICTKNAIKVFPNTTYYFNIGTTITGSCGFSYTDANGNGIGLVLAVYGNATFTTPSNARNLYFYIDSSYGTTYNNDICINLSDTSRNGTYEPYKESTLDLSWIKSIKDTGGNQLFPYGLLSAGSVHDEVGDSYAIKRVGVVDLGEYLKSTSLYEYYEHNGHYYAAIYIQNYKMSSPNLLVPFGETTTGEQIYNGNYGVGYRPGQNAANFAHPSNPSTPEQFINTVTGILCYYELAEPVTVYFDKKPMTYPVDDLGTETLLPEGVDSTTGVPLSAPFNGTFEYKSNFKDAVIDLINAVNNYKNPVRGEDNSDQTVGQLAEYDSDSTVKASGYRASNATISPTGSDNASVLPTVAALIAYVQGVAQNALHYQGTVATVASLPSTGTTAGDVYILSAADGNYDAGDWFIRNKANDGWNVVQGSVRVTNNDVTLTPDGTKKTIANVEGTPITVTMPDMNFAEPTASGDTLTVIDTISQSNGKISATKKTIQDASKSQKGVVQFVNDVHNSTDQTKAVTAGDAWTEFAKRNVKAVDVSQSTPINLFPSVLVSSSTPSASTAPSNWDSSIYGTWTGAPQFVGQLFVSTSGSASIATGTSDVTDWKPITNN